MTSPRFIVAREQYLSRRFLTWRENRYAMAGERKRYPFLLARHALYHGLKALGIAQGDEVLVPAYICGAAVQAVRACGAVPVFFQVDRNCVLNVEDAERRITSRTRALIVVQYFGFTQHLKDFRDLATRRGLALAEDCAHILQRQDAGPHADMRVFSWRKFVPSLYGAELEIEADKFHGRGLEPKPSAVFELKVLKSVLESAPAAAGAVGSFMKVVSGRGRKVRGSTSSSSKSTPDIRSDANNSSFDPLLAGLGLSRISRWIGAHSDLDGIIASRRSNYQGLAQRMAAMSGVLPLFPELGPETCPLYFPIVMEGIHAAHKQIRELGIPATAWDGVRPAGISDTSFPDAAFLYDNLTFLPVHQMLEQRDLDMIVDAVGAVRKRSSHVIAEGPSGADYTSSKEEMCQAKS